MGRQGRGRRHMRGERRGQGTAPAAEGMHGVPGGQSGSVSGDGQLLCGQLGHEAPQPLPPPFCARASVRYTLVMQAASGNTLRTVGLM